MSEQQRPARQDYPTFAGTFSTAKTRDHIEPAIYEAAMDEIDRLRLEIQPWKELKAAMNRNELSHADAYYAVELEARQEATE